MDVTLQGVNLYATLGVACDATDTELKKAYRKKALQLHPDHGGSEAEFALLSLAYNKLLDPDERAYYDRTGQIKEQSNLEQDAWCLLTSIFKGIVDGAGAGILQLDVISEMRKHVNQPIKEGRIRIRQMTKKVQLFGQVKAKLEREDSAPPAFEIMLEENIREAQAHIADVEDAIEIAELALKLLPKYKFINERRNNWENMESALSSYNATTVQRPVYAVPNTHF